MQHITVTERQTDNSSLLQTANRLTQRQFHWLSPDFCHYKTAHHMLHSHRSKQKIMTTYVTNIQTRELCIWHQYIASSRRLHAIVQCAYNMGSEIHVWCMYKYWFQTQFSFEFISCEIKTQPSMLLVQTLQYNDSNSHRSTVLTVALSTTTQQSTTSYRPIGSEICSRHWQFDLRRIYIRPRTGPQSAHG